MSEIQKLNKLYYNPKTGFVAKKKLITKAHEAGIDLTDEQISEWYDSQEINQLWKEGPKKPKSTYLSITAPNIGFIQADLIDMHRYSRKNSGYKWILTLIDVYSRYAWAFPLKTKTPDQVLPHIQYLYSVLDNKFLTFTTDDDGAFKGGVKSFLDEKKIKHYIGRPSDGTENRSMLVEAFNKTLLRYIFKILYASNQGFEWIDLLPDILENYNNSIHSGTTKKPIDVFSGSETPKQPKNPYKNDEIKIGDLVRLKKPETTFNKSTRNPSFTQKVYKVMAKVQGARYSLLDTDSNEVVNKTYLPSDLRVVKKVEKNVSKLTPVDIYEEKKEIDTEQKYKRLNRKENLGIDDLGNIVVPTRLLPKNEKRRR